MPIFRLEDTDGKPLPYELEMDSFDPSRFPLYEVAGALGVTVAKGLTSD